MSTEAKPKDTSEEDGKKIEGKDAGADTDAAKNQDAPKFTQADQNALAAKIRKEEKEKFEKATAEAKRLADEAKAKEQGEFQQLAESRQKELDELKPKLQTATEELDAYKAKVSEMVAAELKELPDEVRDMSPAQIAEDKSITNPLDVLAWLPKGKALAAKLNGDNGKQGMGKDPKPKGPPGTAEADEKAKAQMASGYQNRW